MRKFESYEDMCESIADIGATWMLSALTLIIERVVEKQIFRNRLGIEAYVKNVLDRDDARKGKLPCKE